MRLFIWRCILRGSNDPDN